MAAQEGTYLVGRRFPNRLFVGGLPPRVSAEELAGFFGNFSHNVTDVKIIADEAGWSKGYGFVTFKSDMDVHKVCQMGTLFFRNKKLNIGPAVRKDGPTMMAETVIVPQAPSKGEYFYLGEPCVFQQPYIPYMAYEYQPTYQYQPIQAQEPSPIMEQKPKGKRNRPKRNGGHLPPRMRSQ